MNEELKSALEQMQASIATVLQQVTETSGVTASGDSIEPTKPIEETPQENESTPDTTIETTPETPAETKEPANDTQPEETKTETVSETPKENTYEVTEDELNDAEKMLSV